VPARAAAIFAVALFASGLAALPARAADAPTMEASAMLQGHARVGAWMAIRVHLHNDGPAVTGELRLAGGAQGRTQFGTPVDLPTTSDQNYFIYAQPSQLGRDLEVQLIAGGTTVASRKVAFTAHDATQLVVGVVAEQPQRIVPQINLLPGATGNPASVVPLAVGDLPDRVEAWAPLDRLVWQDVDTQLTSGQLGALRGWLAGGGHLVVVGGTAGPAILSGFPDDILPYRPSATIDVAPQSLTALVGQLPRGASDIPALAGNLARGHALATSDDRAIAAQAAYGSGTVTLLGFDPATPWIAEARSTQSMWRALLPQRSGGAAATGDDTQLMSAVSQLPELTLPPIQGLLALLFGYILLIGPINYLVLRRLDRREWAWITMPALIVLFAAGAYAFGAALRGLDVVVNEVAIVRGAPDATEGMAQVYLGVFSPSRGTYQVEVPGGALLSSTLNGDFTTGGTSATLDVIQGNPARIRDLVVGFGSLRTVRAETPASVPRIQADLRLVDGALTGTIRNSSNELLETPAIALGTSVVVLQDLKPGAEQTITLPIRSSQFDRSLSDRILGQTFFNDPNQPTGSTQRNAVRRAILDQLTYDPNRGTNGALPADGPVLLAWGGHRVLDVRISGQEPRRTGNVLYYIPLGMHVEGRMTFDGELIRSSIVSLDAAVFSKDTFSINMGRGSATFAYRPIPFDGALAAQRVVLASGFGGDTMPGAGVAAGIEPVSPQPCRGGTNDARNCTHSVPPPPCPPDQPGCPGPDFQVPAVEVFDLTGDGSWMRLPNFKPGAAYELRNGARYVDPGTGTLLVRFVNEADGGSNFNFSVRIEGDVR